MIICKHKYIRFIYTFIFTENLPQFNLYHLYQQSKFKTPNTDPCYTPRFISQGRQRVSISKPQAQLVSICRHTTRSSIFRFAIEICRGTFLKTDGTQKLWSSSLFHPTNKHIQTHKKSLWLLDYYMQSPQKHTAHLLKKLDMALSVFLECVQTSQDICIDLHKRSILIAGTIVCLGVWGKEWVAVMHWTKCECVYRVWRYLTFLIQSVGKAIAL